jgi:hypothetical protein
VENYATNSAQNAVYVQPGDHVEMVRAIKRHDNGSIAQPIMFGHY